MMLPKTNAKKAMSPTTNASIPDPKRPPVIRNTVGANTRTAGNIPISEAALTYKIYGCTWHFSSDTHKEIRERYGLSLDMYGQFNGLEILADELVRRTRAEAA